MHTLSLLQIVARSWSLQHLGAGSLPDCNLSAIQVAMSALHQAPRFRTTQICARKQHKHTALHSHLVGLSTVHPVTWLNGRRPSRVSTD